MCFEDIDRRLEDEQPITKEELLSLLKRLSKDEDYEETHWLADRLIIKYINDKGIEDAYDDVGKWYA